MKKLFYLISLLFVSCNSLKETVPDAYIIMNISYSIVNDIKEEFSKTYYDWDETKYGKIYEHKIDTINCLTFSKSYMLYDEGQIIRNRTYGLPLFPNMEYSVLFYNKTKNTKYINDNFETFYTTPLNINKQTQTNKVKFNKTYKKQPPCEEQFSYYNENLLEGQKIEKNAINVNVELKPISFVYFFDIIIYNDKPEIPMDVVSCKYIGLNGVSSSINMFTNETGAEKCLIEQESPKEMQHYDMYSIIGERFITYGLPLDDSSWVEENNDCELGIVFKLSSGLEKNGKINVTKKIKEKPYGGVITLMLNNSDISKEVNGFDIITEDWQVHDYTVII